YLAQQQHKGLLRFLTCGSVDDGKSTLIGRLLHDSAQIYEDQLASLKNDSAKMGTTGEAIDLALLVDGLQAEREQGITIDVAYRYFSSDKRKFIIADTPGHEQYTRNMATGASTCELAVILVDARYGVQTQTKRHAFIASLLGIRHFVVAINKMDLLGFDEQVFNRIRNDFSEFVKDFGELDIHFVPLSALNGDNVVEPSLHTPWYQGGTLLELLETIDTQRELSALPARFPVQYVSRPNLDFRGFAGTLASGVIKVGDEVVALPSGKRSKVERIVTFDGDLPEVTAGQAVTITLEDEIDISRGDLLALPDSAPQVANQIIADLVWMDEKPLQLGQL
ncbi:MAG: sulfate adenylyltransferase subunit CysN, partial [Shewanella sp.]